MSPSSVSAISGAWSGLGSYDNNWDGTALHAGNVMNKIPETQISFFNNNFLI